MFSGIIEELGILKSITEEGSNIHWSIEAAFDEALKVDQSIAHNGVCLTVTKVLTDGYEVTLVDETLRASNLGSASIGSTLNLERCIRMNDRLDGHIVQGHVDTTASCIDIKDQDGSWVFTFQFDQENYKGLVVPKGSITINGVSLTVVNPEENKFSVAIIPYTYEHTNFSSLALGSSVNIEFDIIGKYVRQHLQHIA